MRTSFSYQNDCPSGKAGYATVKAARTALNDCKKLRRFVKRRREKSFYRCELCLNFHITGSFLFPLFHVRKKLVCVLTQSTQFIQLLIIILGNHAAVPN